jgi:tetratricopeptide (TPR) repeat protein
MSRFGFPGRFREYFLTNLQSYRDNYGDEANEQIDRMVYRMVMDAAKAKDQDKLNEAITMGMEYAGEQNPEVMRLSYQMLYDQRAEDWAAYGNHVEEMMGMDTKLGNGQINSYAWNIYLHVEDKDLAKKAAGWMEKVIAEEPSYAYLDTYAAVLYKAGELKKAEKFAKKAIEVGKKDGEKVEETEALLKKIRE